jgi:hypothetical protein
LSSRRKILSRRRIIQTHLSGWFLVTCLWTGMISDIFDGIIARILGVATLITGLLSQLDRIIISSLLPKPECDIPSAYHAYLRRQGKTFKRYKLFN